jgi:glycosyltransferase involved in cell wall biosynthesis
VLVTTRARGTNTPLKLYQYLRSGRPIVATAIRSHTQVLKPGWAELVAPTAEAVAGGILALLRDPERRKRMAANALRVAEERYGEARYHALLRELLDELRSSARARSHSTRKAP